MPVPFMHARVGDFTKHLVGVFGDGGEFGATGEDVVIAKIGDEEGVGEEMGCILVEGVHFGTSAEIAFGIEGAEGGEDGLGLGFVAARFTTDDFVNEREGFGTGENVLRGEMLGAAVSDGIRGDAFEVVVRGEFTEAGLGLAFPGEECAFNFYKEVLGAVERFEFLDEGVGSGIIAADEEAVEGADTAPGEADEVLIISLEAMPGGEGMESRFAEVAIGDEPGEVFVAEGGSCNKHNISAFGEFKARADEGFDALFGAFFGEFKGSGEGKTVNYSDGGESGDGGKAGDFVGEEDASSETVSAEGVEGDIWGFGDEFGLESGGFFDVAHGYADGFVSAFAGANGIVFLVIFLGLVALELGGSCEDGEGGGGFTAYVFVIQVASDFDGGFAFPPFAGLSPAGKDFVSAIR